MRKDTQGIMKKTKYAIALAALGVLSLGVMGCGKKETSTEATCLAFPIAAFKAKPPV